MNQSRKNPEPRHYPPVYEKLIPIALVIIAAVMIALAILSILVFFGWVG